MLAGAGFNANLCPDAYAALRKLSEQPYQVVLCELEVPGMKGMKFVNLVSEEFPDVAVVVVTQPRNLRRAMLAVISGASGYVQTPLRPETLTANLKSALKRKWLESAVLGSSKRRLATSALGNAA
jgi:DNA-binding NtrC family response regulator